MLLLAFRVWYFGVFLLLCLMYLRCCVGWLIGLLCFGNVVYCLLFNDVISLLLLLGLVTCV